MNAAPDLSIIIVSWNVRDLLRDCLRSIGVRQEALGSDLLRAEGAEPGIGPPELTLEMIVIDNASVDGSAAMVATEFPTVTLIANRENLGFTRGNNQGLALAQGRHILFLNPDTIVQSGALATLVAQIEADSRIGACGPQLRYGDGSLQSSRRRFPTFLTALFESTPLAWHWPANRWARWYRMEDRLAPAAVPSDDSVSRPDSASDEVDWLVGAALLVRRSVLDQVGGFDEGYFMYSEELDLCRRIKTAGWRVVYAPQAIVVHFEGKSSEQVVAARHIRFQTSKVRYFRKFHGPFQAELLRVFILLSFAVEWVLEAAKWVLGSKRSLRRQRLAAYGQVLASGLRGSGLN